MRPGDIICEDARAVGDAAARIVCDEIAAAIKQRGVARVALSGGKSPTTTYERLAEFARGVDGEAPVSFEHTHWFWVDERCVPPSSERSNYRMASTALLRPARVPPNSVFRMEGEAEPRLAARRYANVLRREFCPADSPPGSGVAPEDIRFDVVVAAVGSDGHTGSLFPGTGAVREVDGLVTTVDPGGSRERRLTLTRPVLLAARRVVVLAIGAAKRGIVERARSFGSEDEIPARLYNAAMPGTVTWILDSAAAGADISSISHLRPRSERPGAKQA